MKFYPPSILRYFYRYLFVFLLTGLPLCLAVYVFTAVEEGWIISVLCIFIAFGGAILLHVGFWEKLFGTLTLSENEILWKCPLRRTRTIPVSLCVEIGAYLENKGNGIPSEQIYFCDHSDPQICKNGSMKASKHLIKFWYYDALCCYILSTYEGHKTVRLVNYIDQRKRW